jgi:GT2 family glycosyltransferase
VKPVSVVVVNWNAGSALIECLESLFGCHSGLDLDVVLVDNASTDGSAAAAAALFPQVCLVSNPDNRGFAAAVNQGLSTCASGSYVLVLNPDTRFSMDSLGPLTGFMESNPDTAACGPAVIGRDGQLQRGCRRREPSAWGMLCRSLALDRLFPASRVFAGHLYGNIPPDINQPVDSLSGSFMLIRRAALDRVGLFDERFFMYAEDLDWCRRARQAGWKLYFIPSVEVLHLRAVSSRQRPLGRLVDLNYTAAQYVHKHWKGFFASPVRFLMYLALGVRFALSLPFSLVETLAVKCRKRKSDRPLPI